MRSISEEGERNPSMEIRIPQRAPVNPFRKHWQFCVGSGHALLALRTDYTRQLKFIHDTLGIERVRFHGIFCDDMRTFSDLSMQMRVPGAEACRRRPRGEVRA